VFDRSYLEYEDKRTAYGENRFVAIGSVDLAELTLILFVVWTPRFQNRRIISARMAKSHEKEDYRKFTASF
jgi:uncharacterized DUF497 family protein